MKKFLHSLCPNSVNALDVERCTSDVDCTGTGQCLNGGNSCTFATRFDVCTSGTCDETSGTPGKCKGTCGCGEDGDCPSGQCDIVSGQCVPDANGLTKCNPYYPGGPPMTCYYDPDATEVDEIQVMWLQPRVHGWMKGLTISGAILTFLPCLCVAALFASWKYCCFPCYLLRRAYRRHKDGPPPVYESRIAELDFGTRANPLRQHMVRGKPCKDETCSYCNRAGSTGGDGANAVVAVEMVEKQCTLSGGEVAHKGMRVEFNQVGQLLELGENPNLQFTRGFEGVATIRTVIDDDFVRVRNEKTGEESLWTAKKLVLVDDPKPEPVKKSLSAKFGPSRLCRTLFFPFRSNALHWHSNGPGPHFSRGALQF